MLNIVYYILLVFAVLISLGVIWHFASERWQLPCPAWLGWMVEADNPFTKINRSAHIIDQLELQEGMNVLDAGCGPGRVSIPLAKKVGPQGSVTALDIQNEMLNRVREKAEKQGIKNISYINAGLGSGVLKDNAYDRATLVTVIGEIPDQKKALQEIFTVLKPGGLLSITETLFDPHYQRINKILDLAESVGFKKKNIVSDRFSYNLIIQKPVIGRS